MRRSLLTFFVLLKALAPGVIFAQERTIVPVPQNAPPIVQQRAVGVNTNNGVIVHDADQCTTKSLGVTVEGGVRVRHRGSNC